MFEHRHGRLSVLFALLLFVVAAALYLPLTTHTIQESDGGEFATAAVINALVHPPGYPLYMLIASTVVRVSDFAPIAILASLSALFQAGAVALLFVISRSLSLPISLSLAIASAWMLFQPVLRMAADVEVFALHNLIICGLVLSALRAYSVAIPTRFFIVGLFCGLGGSNHHTIVLWAPLVIATIVAQAPSPSTIARRLGAMLLGCTVGLTPYLSLVLPLFEQGTLVYPPISSLADFLKHIFRFQYGTFSLTARIGDFDRSYLPHFIWLTFSSLPLFLAAFPVAAVQATIKRNVIRMGVFLSVALHLLFLSRLVFSGDLEIFGEFTMRFYGFLVLSMAVLFVVSVSEIIKHRWEHWLLVLLLLAPVIIKAPSAIENADARSDRTINHELEAILTELPPRSVFIPAPDRVAMGLYYKQIVEQQRPDIAIVVAGLLNSRGYLSILKDRFSFLHQLDFSKPLELGEIARAAYADGREVFAYEETPAPDGFVAYPIGVSWQWIPEKLEPPRDKVIDLMLAFCTRWPLDLAAVSPTRTHSRFLIGYLFLRPVMELAKVTEGSTGQVLREAVEGFGSPEFEAAQKQCLAAFYQRQKSAPTS